MDLFVCCQGVSLKSCRTTWSALQSHSYPSWWTGEMNKERAARAWKDKYLMQWDWINIWTSSIKGADSQSLPPLCRLLTLHKAYEHIWKSTLSTDLGVPMAKGCANGPHVAHQLGLDIFFFDLTCHTSYVIAFHIWSRRWPAALQRIKWTKPQDRCGAADDCYRTSHFDVSDFGAHKD